MDGKEFVRLTLNYMMKHGDNQDHVAAGTMLSELDELEAPVPGDGGDPTESSGTPELPDPPEVLGAPAIPPVEGSAAATADSGG